jgi:hypothetical protein
MSGLQYVVTGISIASGRVYLQPVSYDSAPIRLGGLETARRFETYLVADRTAHKWMLCCYMDLWAAPEPSPM